MTTRAELASNFLAALHNIPPHPEQGPDQLNELGLAAFKAGASFQFRNLHDIWVVDGSPTMLWHRNHDNEGAYGLTALAPDLYQFTSERRLPHANVISVRNYLFGSNEVVACLRVAAKGLVKDPGRAIPISERELSKLSVPYTRKDNGNVRKSPPLRRIDRKMFIDGMSTFVGERIK